jgi:hypothetical protein
LAGQRGILAGTLPYMSPEQVRRESHHIDGRTDIYSLGVVLYELLCGRRAFEAKTRDELEDQILHREARPLRQIKDSIPAELERICLKALSKRVNERYTTAKDFADELKVLLGQLSKRKVSSPVSDLLKSSDQSTQQVARDLEIVSARYTRESDELDVILRNTADQPAVIHQITLTVVEKYSREAGGGGIIRPSAQYDIPIRHLDEGQSRSLDVSHYVDPQSVDRLTISLHTSALQVLRLTMLYNRVGIVEALVGVNVVLEPEELRGEEAATQFITWDDLRATCGTPVIARCVSREELLQALRDRRIFSFAGPPWVVIGEEMLVEHNKQRLERLAVFPRPLPDAIHIRRRTFLRHHCEMVSRETPDKMRELRTAVAVAQYRTGRHADALATLIRSARLNAMQELSHPTDLAILAMAQHQLGKEDEAKATLDRLRQSLKLPCWAKDPEAQGFMREAEEQIGGEPADKKP